MDLKRSGKKPLKICSTRAWRTYLGGYLLDVLYGVTEPKDSNFPEEWIASLVVARTAGREHIINEGLSKIDGSSMTLKDVIAADAVNMLGEKHYEKYGLTLGVLVKLIDSSERLSIQAHPDRITAKRLFSSEFGKTECWHILGGRTVKEQPPVIYFGFRKGVTREKWVELFKRQDISGMLDCLHKFPANPGDTFLIEGGIPHAIGAGCFLVEIQEPTDYTIRVERVTESGLVIDDFMCHQGLGFEKMFDCFSYAGMSRQEICEKWRINPRVLNSCPDYTEYEIVGYGDTPYFKANIIEIDGLFEADTYGLFYGLFVLSGEGHIKTDESEYRLTKTDQFFIPAYAGKVRITADTDKPLHVVRFFGPKV